MTPAQIYYLSRRRKRPAVDLLTWLHELLSYRNETFGGLR